MKRSSGPRKTANLSESIHQHLDMYALAAGAAGVGVLALAQPIEAKIVYTPDKIRIGIDQQYNLDLNQDGITDFTIQESRKKGDYRIAWTLAENAAASNAVMGNGAAALSRGAQIGSSQAFYGGQITMAFSYCNFITKKCRHAGNWENVTNRYLGLKFHDKNGKTHFGWARFNNSSSRGATLTGYAYETIPNKAIKAGQTKEADDPTNDDFGPGASLTNPTLDTPQPATLGTLAMGSPGLSIWRRKESQHSEAL